jgi:cyclic beta-1,2-glucan synthetase
MHGSFLHLGERLRSGLLRPTAENQAPLRSELFSKEQMKEHGKSLAASHTIARGRASDHLLGRLADNEQVLKETCLLLTTATKDNRRIAPAGEWLLDNFYLIEQQIRTARQHLPKGYSQTLPRLRKGASAGLPRVYDLALETISHGDARVDGESLSGFVAAYQTVSQLKLGELWAIPIMLRLALIENLRRVAAVISVDRRHRNLADSWADKITQVAEADPKNLILVIADMARSNPPMVSSFVAELVRRLQGQGPALALPLTWVEQQLAGSDSTIDQLIRSENQQQATDQLSISNTIASLRFLDANDWRAFVESTSVVERSLLADPEGVYGRMSFATRDHYRHVVEAIARKSEFTEGAVADRAVELARESWDGKGNRAGHVGFYLIAEGRPTLERAVAMRGLISRVRRSLGRHYALPLYLGILFLGSLLAGWISVVTLGFNSAHITETVLLLVFTVLVASQFLLTLMNWLITKFTVPDELPRMDLSAGILPELRTLVVVPTMLTSNENASELLEAIEVRFLANRDEHVHFALLSDFGDAPQENMPEDAALLEIVRSGIAELNRKYSCEKSDSFFLLHRPRRWNAGERLWMGYERKRGKLEELNSFLRGQPGDHFVRLVGRTAILRSVRYVITLDTDTELPRDSVRQFVGAMAHPLNHARYDGAKQRVTHGYGILQPRVAASLAGTNHSRYARLWGGEPGIDPYTRAVSDVYQDFFGEGSFVGKGIYDVDIFRQAVDGRFPENRILSHDLIEGCYARSGLLSDVQLYEDYPPTYDADVARRHRWIRGDWQIARWILPRVPGPDNAALTNPLSLLSRWKIADNLRRSLVPSAFILLFLLIWLTLSPLWAWTLTVVGTILVPVLLIALFALGKKPEDMELRQHLRETANGFGRHSLQALFTLACLPHEAYFSLDAVIRAHWRMLFSHRKLLEWKASGEHRQHRSDLAGQYLSMWPAPFYAVAVLACLVAERPAALGAAAPLVLLWLAAPAVAWWTSLPLKRNVIRLSAGQAIFLGQLSRKTWSFFERFVGEEDHWLPPDNFQESPVATVAHRTSPTNIGLSLLANLSAYDTGYIPAGELLHRTGSALATMNSLQRYRGHFYNWYNTLTLTPLSPLYISTVDSGNLVAHLLTLEPGLASLADQPILAPRFFSGLTDTVGVLMDVAKQSGLPGSDQFRPALLHADELKQQLESLRLSFPATLPEARASLEQLHATAGVIRENLSGAGQSLLRWADVLVRQCRAALDDLNFLVPSADLKNIPQDSSLAPLNRVPTLRELASLDETAAPGLHEAVIREGVTHAKERMAEIDRLLVLCGDFARVEYEFLYDETRHLMSIGYNVSNHRRDAGYYDLLASEARLASFVAIAQGQVPQENWFSLGRQLTHSSVGPTLLSWDGSMFEYLMPLLVMPTYANTLLDESYKAAVELQIEYGGSRRVPWGISESGYSAVDVQMNYQYRAFGVPGLGLKRGLAEDTVIAPYATALALLIMPEAACTNLQRLSASHFEGEYGFYEAIDYTASRLPRGQSHVIVRSYMAHHQGMSLLALAHVLADRPMQKRFESVPIFQATTLLLHEKVPKAMALYSTPQDLPEPRRIATDQESSVRVFRTANTFAPEVQLLSNGKYHVMVSNAGGGYSRWKDMDVTRWREDATRDSWGTFCYIRDVATGRFWSSAHQPVIKPLEHYEAIFSEAKVEFRCREAELEAHTEIAVSPEDDIELRRITLTNRGKKRRVIEITSYSEVVLASSASDVLHPAFSNLFVQTEILEDRRAILCTRRPRSNHEQSPWMFHLMVVHGATTGTVSYETDRMEFIGRGNTVANPHAMNAAGPLSGNHGSVLDPIVAIRYQITLQPGQSATASLVMGVGENRERCLQLADKYQDRNLADRVFDLAWTHAQVLLRQLNATEVDAQSYGRLASSIIYANPSLRADASVIAGNTRTQSGLWGYSVSGDLPIVLLQVSDLENVDLVRQLVQAQAYWRLKGLAVDLMIWNENHAGYRQALQDRIMDLVAAAVHVSPEERGGKIFVRVAEQMSDEDRMLFQAVARAIISDARGSLNAQLSPRRATEPEVPPIRNRRAAPRGPQRHDSLAARDLLYFNGLGGFTRDGREYVITVPEGQTSAAPWVNVIANPEFGSVISESGSAYTWAENAHEFRLTPWHNDPVSDGSGEAFFLRDEENGNFWSPTLLPARGSGTYVIRHGFGYSIFEHTEDGITSELKVYVATDASVKFCVIKVSNHSGRDRKLSVTGYVEWLLGDIRPKSMMHVITQVDQETEALLAHNAYNGEFQDRVAFFDSNQGYRTITGDRTEFLGRNGTLSNPAAMYKQRLSGKVSPGLDPCAAIRIPFDLVDGQEREMIFTLGVGQGRSGAVEVAMRFRGTEAARTSLEAVWHYWTHTLGAVNVDTPDQSLNVMANGWLLYQTLACRLWARSGYYQSGGAFGFRDQLQDTMALVHAEAGLIRKQILLCASRQFSEGDVQHWWHPPAGRGVRTHCSDDYLWLPLAVCRYVSTSGDTGVLDEPIFFLEGRPVKAEEDSYYDLPGRSETAATVYEHCVRSILAGLKRGEHGLPLIGTGDWNDGMNLVGEHGKGESVWLGFFLHEVLSRFAELATRRGDSVFADRCHAEAGQMRENIEEHAWDGEWYRRAYFDDGSPLGSSANQDCQIDSIAQSWSVLSGAGDTRRSEIAMNSLDRRLVDREHGLIKLLTPPFDKGNQDPGYIKGYVPGVRENGGQYTHAAIWAAMAFASRGDSKRAWELFDMINPVNHASTPADVARYKVEPYVMAADIYAVSPHTGRGGWTWYTGSAGWMYRLVIESLLGLRLEVDRLHFHPCFPPEWSTFKVHYRYYETVYHITVNQGSSSLPETQVTLDELPQSEPTIPLLNDGKEHFAEVAFVPARLPVSV